MNTGLMLILVDNDSIWLKEFTDDECTAAIHRWNWLLDGDLTIKGDTAKTAYIKSWLFCEKEIRTPVAFEPYTISERISNFCLFDRVRSGKKGCEFNVQPQIKKMAYDLARNLEFKEQTATGNHIVNNARALFLAGIYCADDKLMKLSASILRLTVPKFVGKDGLLVEGSSHYHFLFNRWLLEIIWVADAEGMVDLVAFLQPYLNAVSKASKSCLVIGSETADAPVIGDVSPDFAFSNLFSIAFSKVENGAIVFTGPSAVLNEGSWARLVRAHLNITTSQANDAPETDPPMSSGRNGWCRYDIHDWTLFLNNNHGEPVDRAGHFHEDFLSPVLFWKGQRSIVDVGRRSYDPADELGRLQSCSQCHNGIVINGYSPARDLPNRQNIPLQLKHFANSYKLRKVGNDLKIEVAHDGFSNFFGKKITHIRSFFLKKRSFQVTDNLIGADGLNIETNFFLDPKFFETSVLKMSIDNCHISGCSSPYPCRDHRLTSEEGAYVSIYEEPWLSHEYGKNAPVVCIKARRESCSDFFHSYFEIKVKG